MSRLTNRAGDQVQIGEMVRALRALRGWEQTDLADATKGALKQPGVSTLERQADSFQNEYELEAVSTALGYTLAEVRAMAKRETERQFREQITQRAQELAETEPEILEWWLRLEGRLDEEEESPAPADPNQAARSASRRSRRPSET